MTKQEDMELDEEEEEVLIEEKKVIEEKFDEDKYNEKVCDIPPKDVRMLR